MALYTGRLLMRGGNEADFDADKMMPREWSVSTDKKIVRICIAPGVCIRMATYDAFEEDMAKIENILKECQSIQEVVVRINTEVSQNADAVAEYTAQAKQYRDEAKRFRDEAFATTPDGYAEVVETVAKNTVKIDTVIEKADLGIKETASGEEIHLIDSADGKAVEFALYGKATQDGEPTPENPQEIEVSGESYNLLENTAKSQTINGVTFTVNEDKSVTANGTATSNADLPIIPIESKETFFVGKYKLSGCPIGGSDNKYSILLAKLVSGSANRICADYGSGGEFELSETTDIFCSIRINSGQTVSNLTFKPMIRKASVKNDRYMPYGKGSVEVKSVGKNLLKPIESKTSFGITYTTQNDGTVLVNGETTTDDSYTFRYFNDENKIPTWLEKGKKYVASIVKNGVAQNLTTVIQVFERKNNTWVSLVTVHSLKEFTISEDASGLMIRLYIPRNTKVQNEVIYPMIRLATDTDETYQPYKETLATIPTENGLAGIKVSNGGNYTDSNGQQWICDEVVKYSDGSGEKIKNIGKVILDEKSNILITTIGTQTLFKGETVPHAKKGSYISKCSHYNGNGILSEGQFRVDNSNWYLRVDMSGFSTVEEFKSFLTEEKNNGRPFTFYYELATPITTPLTAEELAEISTFYPVTNISNDADCGMKVTYLADGKNYIDNQLALQAQAQENALLNMLLLMPEETQAAMIENDTNNLLAESEE